MTSVARTRIGNSWQRTREQRHYGWVEIYKKKSDRFATSTQLMRRRLVAPELSWSESSSIFDNNYIIQSRLCRSRNGISEISLLMGDTGSRKQCKRNWIKSLGITRYESWGISGQVMMVVMMIWWANQEIERLSTNAKYIYWCEIGRKKWWVILIYGWLFLGINMCFHNKCLEKYLI